MFLALFIVFSIVLFILVRNQFSYWKRAGVPEAPPSIPFGNFQPVARKERSFGLVIYDIYKQTSEPFLGVYLFFRPALLVRDPELVKNVLTRDFQHFHDRGVYHNPKADPLSGNLFAMPGDEWKSLRTRLTPAFTSGKLKGMFPIVHNVGKELVKFMEPMADKNEILDMRDIAARYVIDCLASILFGQEGISTIKNPNHEFRTSGRKFNDNKEIVNVIRRSLNLVCPKLLTIFHIKAHPQYMQKFCIDMVTRTIEERERKNAFRKDLMQCLIQLRNNSDNKLDAEWKINASGKSIKSMSCEEIAAQVFIFYVAGSETSTSTVAFTLYELTQNEELMKRAQADIKSTLAMHDGELTYESIMEMKFIDLCVKETLRKYPGLPILSRECTKDYPIPGSKFTIQKGTPVIISLLGIHRDAQYFPNPEQYDPDRFTEEKHAYDEDMYMPFGVGPRNCIAYRMGLLVVKMAIVMLLTSYKFEATSKKELEFDFGAVELLPKPGQSGIRILRK